MPSLRATDELDGIHRAQHALNMLFGPVRAFKEWQPCELSLIAEVRAEKATVERHGVFQLRVDSFDNLPLDEVFQLRRCTATNTALFPGYSLVTAGAALPHLNTVEQLVFTSLFELPVAEIAAASLPRPPLPPSDKQGDISERADGPARRSKPLRPGEQPSGADVHDDLFASYPSGRFRPHTADPLAFMGEWVPQGMLTSPDTLRKAQEEDAECCAIHKWLADGLPPTNSIDKSLHPLRKQFASMKFSVSNGVLYSYDEFALNASDSKPHLRCVLHILK